MVYRNIYVANYNRLPMYLFVGMDNLYYTGSIFYNIKTLPDNYDKNKDLYINCDCQFKKWKNVNKIIK